ncbi:MAG: hypothetical protein RPU41_03200 [Candidatus Sedimenticola sp. (ex Thyasira tokunagai)]
MIKDKQEKERSYNLLVYGIEKRGLDPLKEQLQARNYLITFEPFNTGKRFNDYDGVILFQGIFEKFESSFNTYNVHLKHSCEVDELDKRKKEAQLLIDKGGFLCFMLCDEFIDSDNGRDFKGSDLAKYHLNYYRFHRDNFQQRIAHVNIKSDDFRKFLRLYGAASTHFSHYNDSIEWEILADVSRKVVGMIINRNEYFIPTLIPDNRPEIIKEYFTYLVEGVTSSYNKLQHTLPDWIHGFSFVEENDLHTEKGKLENQISEIDYRLGILKNFKSVLALSGNDLVESVIKVFRDGFQVAVDEKDELREDFKLLNVNSDPICLCEVKGTNKGAKREYINQADSHRERSGFDDDFPSLLIINTHIKNARTVSEKYQDIANEQILHAVKMNVLIVRTIDLLNLLKIYVNKQITIEEVKGIFTTSSGWLKVSGEMYALVTEGSS